MPDNTQRYVEVTSRLNTVAGIGAAVITLLLLVATWGDWVPFSVLLGVQVALIPFNAWVSLRLLQRWGVTRAELLRTSVNLGAMLVSSLVAGWPFPVWFWMIFVALVFDQFGARVYWTVLLSFIVVECVAGLMFGAPWLHPVCFAVFALICSQISSARVGVIRHMLVRSDEQRAELERAHAEVQQAHERLVAEIRVREQMEIELRQAQKLEAVGRLAAGVAHEINTPVQFVSDSVHFVREASEELLGLIETYRRVQRELIESDPGGEASAVLAEAEEAVDLEYHVENVPKAVARSLEGLDRIATIVRSMKEFAHPDQKEKTPVDINQAIRSTVTIARGEYKHVAELELDLAQLPPVTCHAGEINQVVLNLIVNAAHAIEDTPRDGDALGRIAVRTRVEGAEVVITVEDSGVGIPLDIRDRIFDPFFTTKETGRGTGQGLAIARSVVQKHAGALTFESELGVGTTFSVRLPIRADESRTAAA